MEKKQELDISKLFFSEADLERATTDWEKRMEKLYRKMRQEHQKMASNMKTVTSSLGFENGAALSMARDWSRQDKALLTYRQNLANTVAVQRQFAAATASTSRETQIIRNGLQTVGAQLQEAFRPLAQVALPIINTLLVKLSQLIQFLSYPLRLISAFLGGVLGLPQPFTDTQTALGGVQQGLDGSAASAGKLTEETKKMGKAAKGALAAFDEINLLRFTQGSAGSAGSDSGSVSVGGSTVSAPALPDLSPVENLWVFDEGKLALLQSVWEWGSKIHDVFSSFGPVFSAVGEVVGPALQILVDTVKGVFGQIVELVGALAAPIVNFFNEVLAPVASAGLQAFSELWNEHFQGAFTALGEFIVSCAELPVLFYQTFIAPIISFLQELFTPVIQGVLIGALELWKAFSVAVADNMKSAIAALNGLLEFLKGVFTLNWKRAVQGLIDFGKNLFTSAVNGLKGLVNIGIDVINFFIDKVEWAINKIIGIVNKFSFLPMIPELEEISWPRIPRLAKGGIVQDATLALIGEAGPEAVVPLNSGNSPLPGANQLAPLILEAAYLVVDAIDRKDTNLVFDTDHAAKTLLPKLNKESNRLGRAAFSYR